MKIQSEHVARVIDVGTLDTGSPYMVMEFLQGQDLSALIEAKVILSVEDAVAHVLEACDAIAEAHSVGIVHRDLKLYAPSHRGSHPQRLQSRRSGSPLGQGPPGRRSLKHRLPLLRRQIRSADLETASKTGLEYRDGMSSPRSSHRCHAELRTNWRIARFRSVPTSRKTLAPPLAECAALRVGQDTGYSDRRKEGAMSSRSSACAARILCVDDDDLFGAQLASWLSRLGFDATLVQTAVEGLVAVARRSFGLALVDWNLGGALSGLQLCAELRALKMPLGIIMLSARTETADRVLALDAGADDFVSKPFEPEELSSRIRSLLRRCESPSIAKARVDGDAHTLEWGSLKVRLMDGVTLIEGVERRLTPCQTRILARLIRAAGELVTCDEIWADFGVVRPPNLGNIRVHIHALRRHLDDHGYLIKAVSGRGYTLRKTG